MDTPTLRQVADLFAAPPVIAEMAERVAMGLHEWEMGVVGRWFPPTGRVLDLGCGPGREALPLARLGYDVVAADMSEAVLEHAREHADAAGVALEFALVDGVHVPHGPFDAIIMWAQLLGNIPDRDDQLALLRNCRAALTPDGIVSASGHCEDYCRRVWGDQTEAGWFYPTGSWTPGALRYHMFRADTLEALFREAGFAIVATEVPESLPAIIHTVARKP